MLPSAQHITSRPSRSLYTHKESLHPSTAMLPHTFSVLLMSSRKRTTKLAKVSMRWGSMRVGGWVSAGWMDGWVLFDPGSRHTRVLDDFLHRRAPPQSLSLSLSPTTPLIPPSSLPLGIDTIYSRVQRCTTTTVYYTVWFLSEGRPRNLFLELQPTQFGIWPYLVIQARNCCLVTQLGLARRWPYMSWDKAHNDKYHSLNFTSTDLRFYTSLPSSNIYA